MEYTYEIINAIENSGEHKVCILNMLRELSNVTVDSHFHFVLEQRIKNECKNEQRCPECFGIMSTRSYRESRGFYGMEPAYEKMYEFICPFCGHRE